MTSQMYLYCEALLATMVVTATPGQEQTPTDTAGLTLRLTCATVVLQ